MLEAIFSEGITTVTVTGLTQWDYGRKLTIKGLSYTDNVEVHFSNNIEKEAVVMEVTKSGSDLVTEVPNVLLEKNHDITAWVYIDSGTSGETVRTINLKVKPRIKPADYISENNAGKVIDYVAKAEEYASSAQESAEIAHDNAEKVQANTDLVQDILANVPDFDSYEKLAEHNKLLYDGLYVKGETYSGIASNKGIKLHSVKGKTTQQTTNGYQLFDSSKLATKSLGGATVTNNNDGSFTISGSGNLTGTFSNLFNYSKEESLKLLKVGTYKSNTENTTPQIRFGLRNVSNGTFVTGKCISYDYKTITLTEEDIQSIEDGTNILSIGFLGNSGNTIIPATIKPMIYIDGTGEFEPFTGGKPGPNPDYPMPIENVEISEITSHGRNLLEIRKLREQTLSGVTFRPVYVGESLEYVVVNGTATSQANYVLSNRLNFDKKLFLQGCPTGGSLATYSLLCAYYDRQSKSYKNEVYDIGDGRTVDTDIYETQFSILVRQGTTCNNLIFYPMLRRTGDTDTSYTPYQSNTTSTNLTLAQDDIYQNETITRARKQVTFDGSSDEAWSLQSINNYGLANFNISLSPISNGNTRIVLSNRFKRQTSLIANTTEEGIYLNALNQLFIRIDKNRLSTQDTSGFRTWLSTHNTVVEYKLATPITEEFKVPTIPSYYPFTNVSTDCNLETEIQYEILANSDNSLYQEELEKRIEALEHAMLER